MDLSDIWEASHHLFFFGRMSNDLVIYILQKIQQSIIQQRSILIFFSCWEGAKHDHMHSSLGGKSSTTPIEVRETSGLVHLDVVTVLALFGWYAYLSSKVIHGCSYSRAEIGAFQSCMNAAKDGRKRVVVGQCICSKHSRVTMAIVTGHRPEHCHISYQGDLPNNSHS